MKDSLQIDDICFDKKIAKKKRKKDKSLISMEYSTEYTTVEDKCQKSKIKLIGETIDHSLTFEHNYNSNTEYFEKTTHKNNKKHNKSLISAEHYTNFSSEKEKCGKSKRNLIENIDRYSPNELKSKKKKSNSNSLADIPLENNYSFNNKHSKKNKHDKSLISAEQYTNFSSKKEKCGKSKRNLIENIDSYSLNELKIKKKKSNSNSLADIPLENSYSFNNKHLKKTTPIKKNKHDKILISAEHYISCSSEKEKCGKSKRKLIENIDNYSPNELKIKKKKYKSNSSADILLENNCSSNNKHLKKTTPIKKNKHDKSLISAEHTTNPNTEEEKSIQEFIEKIDNYNSSEMKIEENSKNSILSDIPFENNYSSNNKINESITHLKEKEKHDTNLISSKNILQNTKIKSNNLKLNNVLSNMVPVDIKTIVCNIRSLQQNLTKYKNNNDKEVESDSNDSRLRISDENDYNIVEVDEFEDLLNTINFPDNESDTLPITTESKIDLNKFDLISYLITSKSSFESYLNDSSILKVFSKQIKNIINKSCQMVTQSDIVLIQIIGEKLLEKIIQKNNISKGVKHLHIKVPLESRNNEIHYVETTLSRQPKKEKLEMIKKLQPSVKLGIFNEEEDNIIKKYWSKFQQEYNISDIQPFLSNGLEMALPYNERLNFFRYISTGLPNRLLFSVYNRFNALYNNKVNNLSFEKEEDEIILKVDNCDAIKNKFSVLSLILKRKRLQLYRRLHTLKMQPLRSERIIWDNLKRQELFTNILLQTNTDNWRDLKNIKIIKNVWIKIIQCLSEPISYEKARTQWSFLSTMLFCETPIKYSAMKLTLLEFILQINPNYWSDLNWVEITNKFYPGACSKVIVTLFHWWITKRVPLDIRKNIKDTLKYLTMFVVDSVVKQIENGKDKQFPRLTVKNYDLLVEIE